MRRLSISDIHKKNRRQSHISGLGQWGYTLVELLVTFALFAIFMTAVVMCLPGITKIYMQLQQINHEKTICNTVSNEIQTQLQGILGVEADGDPLGVKNGNGLGYLALLNERGAQIPLTHEPAATSGSAVLPAADISGSGIEFAYMNGIAAQMDTNGFDGYTMRKNKLQMDYHGAHAVSPGALVTRYYEADIEKNTRTATIDYQAAAGNYSVASGVSVSDGIQNVAYAIRYPYVPSFYEGFELQTTFTIKKDACYTAGSGTTESPARVYVNYVNYTLSLLKDGQLCYSQDYVVNIQNAVPYLGTKVAEEPEKPKPTMKDTYVKPDSTFKLPDTNEWTYQYGFTFHIEPSMDENGADTWIIQFPDNMKIVTAWIPGDHNTRYTTRHTDHTIIIERNAAFGFKETDEFIIYYQLDRPLDDYHVVDGSDYITCISTPYATPTNSNVEQMQFTRWGDYDSVVNCKVRATDIKVKTYVEVTYEKEVESARLSNEYANFVEVDGKTVRIYGYRITPGTLYEIQLLVKLKDGTKTEDPVSVRIGDEWYQN